MYNLGNQILIHRDADPPHTRFNHKLFGPLQYLAWLVIQSTERNASCEEGIVW